MQLSRLFICAISLTLFISLLHLLPDLQSAWPLESSWLMLAFAVLQLLCLLVFALLVSLLDNNQEPASAKLITQVEGQ